MFKPFTLAALIAVAGLVETGRAQWIDFDTMIKDAVARQNAIIGAAEHNTRAIVERNMNDPNVQEMYRTHRMQGGMMSLEQFAYWYAATAGGTNVKGYFENERDIAAKEAAAEKAYHDHITNLWGDVKRHKDEVNGNVAEGRGNLLGGGWSFSNPHTGGVEYLPTNVPAGHVETDYYGGRRMMHTDGSYEYTTPTGWNFPMFPVWGR
jgi:hypothetical protein